MDLYRELDCIDADLANIERDIQHYQRVDLREARRLEDELNQLSDIEKELGQNIEAKEKPKASKTKLTYKQNQILQNHPALIEALESRISELNHALSTPEIYQKIGLQTLFEELEEKKGELNLLENEYFEVLELSQN